MRNENMIEPQNPQCVQTSVSGSSLVKKFRRGKKFQEAYFEIGNTNQSICNLIIEAESFKRHGNIEEYNARIELAEKFKEELRLKYDAEIFDLDYYMPQSSGLYVRNSKRDVL